MIYERLLDFVRRIANTELCDDEDKKHQCYAGPCCGAHAWFTDEDLVREARALIQETEIKAAD